MSSLFSLLGSSIFSPSTIFASQKKPEVQTETQPSNFSVQSTDEATPFVSGALSVGGTDITVLQAQTDETAAEPVAETADTASAATSPFDTWFADADQDGDGALNESEFVAARPDGTTEQQAQALFASVNSTNSDSVTLDQFKDAFSNDLIG